MCGSVRLQDKDKFYDVLIKQNQVLNGNLIWPKGSFEGALLPFSEHRFMQIEKKLWWMDKHHTKFYRLPLVHFVERGVVIPVPREYTGLVGIYNNTVSLVTISVDSPSAQPTEVVNMVKPIHHRMPFLYKWTA